MTTARFWSAANCIPATGPSTFNAVAQPSASKVVEATTVTDVVACVIG